MRYKKSRLTEDQAAMIRTIYNEKFVENSQICFEKRTENPEIHMRNLRVQEALQGLGSMTWYDYTTLFN